MSFRFAQVVDKTGSSPANTAERHEIRRDFLIQKINLISSHCVKRVPPDILVVMNPENTPISPTVLKKNSWKPIVKEVIIFAIIAFGIVLPFRIYIAEPYLVDGRSMDPTFATSDYLIVDKISYRFKEPERNSVLVFRYPGNLDKNFIKRIIGLPGETVKIEGEKVTIINTENPEGLELPQSYVVNKFASENISVTLSQDEYFVMGDNRAESFDSRYWGPLNKKYLLGQPVIRLLPVSKIDIMPGVIDSK
jgi:signal peptidase I